MTSVSRRPRRFGHRLILAGAIAFVLLVFAMLSRVEPVRIAGSHLVRTGSGVFVEGTVRNTGPDAGAISLEVTYYDHRGQQVGQETVSIDRLRNGAETRFRTAGQRLDDVRDFTIRIDRGHNPYGN